MIDNLDTLICGAQLTKETRQELFGSVAGGSGSMKPEKYQRNAIIQYTGLPCEKTNMRINMRTNTLENISAPNKKQNGFDYTEDFDGYQYIENIKIYINIKSVVGMGGAQTRTLREVYWFIEGQLQYLLQTPPSTETIYFANILDGDETHRCIDKYLYILNLPCYEPVKKYVFVGDLRQYILWFRQLCST